MWFVLAQDNKRFYKYVLPKSVLQSVDGTLILMSQRCMHTSMYVLLRLILDYEKGNQDKVKAYRVLI